MKLVRARVTDFKSIDDSGWVDIDDVTCMVGKNESGKTGFLDALKRLNPVDGHEQFALKDYPRKGYVKYKRRHEESPAIAITAVFQLSDDELEYGCNGNGQGFPLVLVSFGGGTTKNLWPNVGDSSLIHEKLRMTVALALPPNHFFEFLVPSLQLFDLSRLSSSF